MFAGFPITSLGLHPDHTSPRNIYGIGDFRAHIFCPKTTQELHEQDSLKKIDSGTLDTRKFTRRFDGVTNNAKGIFENLSRS